jgi:ABC-type protease/lipase transport system fused ATPase/permease subunit
VQDNLLMGRVSYGIARAEQSALSDAVSGLLAEMGLMDEVLGIGLEFDVGSGGRRLSSAQRQKVGSGPGADQAAGSAGAEPAGKRARRRVSRR